jgi:hypothetical protein
MRDIEFRGKGYSINKISIALKTDWDTIKLRIKDIHDNPELLDRE